MSYVLTDLKNFLDGGMSTVETKLLLLKRITYALFEEHTISRDSDAEKAACLSINFTDVSAGREINLIHKFSVFCTRRQIKILSFQLFHYFLDKNIGEFF
jgi:hypothetical protein